MPHSSNLALRVCLRTGALYVPLPNDSRKAWGQPGVQVSEGRG